MRVLIALLGVGLSSCGGEDRARGNGDGTSSGPGGATLSGGAETTSQPTSGADSTVGSGPDGEASDDDGDEDEGDDDGASDDTDGGCQSSADCQGNAAGTICDLQTGECVGCTADEDACSVGTYCDPARQACIPGCMADAHCGSDLVCNLNTNQCTGCVANGDCPPGTICGAGTCVAGCTPMQPCQPGLACCAGSCVDISSNLDHCGGCNSPCAPANARGICQGGFCDVDECDIGFVDCNNNVNDGCEWRGTCTCTPDATRSCYTGPQNTEGRGLCRAGEQTCNASGTGWGPCLGEVIPATEVCNSGFDENCDGEVDENPDLDEDGWGVCDGDCCDVVGPGCLNPKLVNPGAFEYPGNMVDDDCDGTADNVLPTCDAGLASNSNNALDYARAIDLCQFTTENPPLPERIWGVITADLLRADGTADPATVSRSIRNGFGSVITNREGARLAVLSTGRAAAEADTNPAFRVFQNGQDTEVTSGFPPDWLEANGGTLPNAPGCPNPLSGRPAYNPIMLKIRVRAPTNASSFSVDIYFFSAEYPEYICTRFNDFFVTLVDSTADNPADKNIAIYTQGNDSWPVGVNLLQAASGLFKQCENGPIRQFTTNAGGMWGCHGPVGTYGGCVGTNELMGTGFDRTGSTTLSCGFAGMHGGATSWLGMRGNVTPGETMEIRFAIWDTSDPWLDSVVLLDNWRWSISASQPGVTPQ